MVEQRTGGAGSGRRCHRAAGQATVGFAFAGTLFLLITFGTIAFGRVIFIYTELHNAVREGARYGKVHCDNETDIKNVVKDKAPTINLTAANTITVTGEKADCTPPSDKITVQAETTFSTVTRTFLGIAPITLKSLATVDVEEPDGAGGG